MTFREAVARLDDLDPHLTIYAENGADADATSEAVIALDPEDGSVPAEADGMKYVLEVIEAQEVTQVWQEWRDGREPTLDQRCEAILHYAKHDTYLPA